MDKETEKQALEACERWCNSPMDDDYADMRTPAVARRAYLAGYAEARGRASGQQGMEGYKLVPVEPTDEMQREGNDRYNEMVSWSPIKDHPAHRPHIYEAYKAMLAASPQITSPAEKQEGTPK